ncbi:hypothetical protein ABZ835_33445 [Streptomyces sp. NPDC047461]|uniref:hypothetical protein n=1 Tax=Streptomyces sp. NPDC047461 TaxID=3155619 RepID=UPI0033D23A76
MWLFRSAYWRQHLTAHGAANDLLLAFQNQHRLPARAKTRMAMELEADLMVSWRRSGKR